MGRFAVTPDELVGAAGTLRGMQADLAAARGARGIGGDFGSPELEAAVTTLVGAVERVAAAMDSAVVMAALNTDAAAGAYTTTDTSLMGGGG